MKSKRLLTPGFLNKFDDHLLINNPVAWSARTHLVAWYAFVFNALLLVACILAPNDPRDYSDTYAWSFFVAIISFLGFIFWLIYLLRFNPFKRFGLDKPGDGIKTFFLYFIAIAGLVLAVFIPDFIETQKADKGYDAQELVDDFNGINLRITLLEKDSIPKSYRLDTCRVVDTLPGHAEFDEYADEVTIAAVDTMVEYAETSVTGEWKVIDTATLARRFATQDTAWMINDSTVVFGTTPDYLFLHVYQCNPKGDSGVWNSQYLFRKVFYSSNPTGRKQLFDELTKLIRKYDTDGVDPIPNYASYRNENEPYLQRIRGKYLLSSIDNSFYNICRKKYRWSDFGWAVYLRLFYYFTLAFTILIFAFRHSTVKTFFLTLLVATLLLIITSIAMSLLRLQRQGPFIIGFLYYGLFLILAVLGATRRTRSAIHGIALNLFLFCTPFIFLLITGYYYYWQNIAYEQAYLIDNTISRDVYFKNENLHYLIAEIAGSVVLFILLEPLFKKLYRKWYSLPEE